MKFKKGSQVEVLNKNDLPSGSWRHAEIISGNGHTYTVKYDNSSLLQSESIIDRVSRKIIRPCPPMQEFQRLVPGDVLEVFTDFCWKIATISRVISGDLYVVRLLGSCKQLTLDISYIRLRQSWESDRWLVIRKSFRSYKDITDRYQKIKSQELQDDKWKQVTKDDFHMVSSTTRKRSSPYGQEDFQKIRVIEGIDRCQRGKVDVAYPLENLGEKYMHVFFGNENETYEMERHEDNDAVQFSLSESLEAGESDNDACSVGSCSIANNRPNKLSNYFLAHSSQDVDTCSSDAESIYVQRDEKKKYSFPSKDELKTGIHRLELHAYICTLNALFASGPLSWEKEELLTNLRFSLHISNDEHLIEGQRDILVLLPMV